VRGIVFGCFAGNVPKSSFRDLGTRREPNESQTEAKGGTKREERATKMHIKIDLRKRSLKGSQKGSPSVVILMTFWSQIRKKPYKNQSKIVRGKAWKITTKRLPKWSRNRCQNSSVIEAKTGIEKDQEKHGISCFSERVKAGF
jgi:hypothetical protein